MAKRHTFTKFCDPQHGWLRVPMKLFSELPVTATAYSYVSPSGRYVYLEEDCDVGPFLERLKTLGIDYHVKYRYTNSSSKIRQLNHFGHIYQELKRG